MRVLGRFAVASAVGMILGGGGPARADQPPAGVEEELARFKGTWQLISARSDGKWAMDERTRDVRVTITATTHTVRFADQIIAHDVAFTIDPSATPKQVTDTLNDGPEKGKTIQGIYRLEGDTLVSCVAHVGHDRPLKFEADPGSGHTLRVFRRVKPADAAKTTAIEAELKRFEGTWKFASMEFDGKSIPEEVTKASRLILKEDRFSSESGPRKVRGVFEVDPTVSPKTIEVTFVEGSTPGETLLGIYELEGDTYKVCMGTKGKPRPKAFVSTPGTGDGLQVLKREKP